MAHGRLGAVDLTANTARIVYTVPPQAAATVSINVCCRNTDGATISLAIVDGIAIDALLLKDFIMFGYEMLASDVQNMSGVALGAGQSIYAISTASEVSVNVWGVTSPTA